MKKYNYPLEPLSNARLLGRWQSDGDRTLRSLREHRQIDGKQKIGLKSIFGQMRVTYSLTTYSIELDGTTETMPYKVLGCDKTSIVIRTIDAKPQTLVKSEFSILHFDDSDTYWLFIEYGQGMREYFKRIKQSEELPKVFL